MQTFRSYDACTAIGVALMLFTTALGAQSPDTSRACRVDGWSTVRPLATADGRSLYVETPSTLQLARGLAYIGAPAFIWHSTDAFLAPDSAVSRRELEPYLRSLGALSRHDGSVTPIPEPADSLRARSPMALATDAGGAHVVWATASDTSRMESDALAYANFDGDRWTTVERVIDHAQLSWTPLSAALAIVGNAPAVAVPSIDTTDRSSHSGVDVGWRRAGQWMRSRVRTDNRLVGAASIGDDGRGMPLVAYASLAQDSAGRDRSAVSIARADTSLTWSARSPIAWLDHWFAHDIQLVRVGARLYAVWAAQRDDRSAATRVDVYGSDDFGVTWTALPSLELPSEFAGLRAVALPNGSLVISALEMRETRALVLATMANERWSLEERSDMPAPWSMPRMTALAHDSLLLTWGTAKPSPIPGGGEAQFPVLHQARLRVSCKRPRP